MRNLYDILEVPLDASAEAIKAAQRARAIENHPDKNQSDATASARMVEVNCAYGVLSDEDARATYDAARELGVTNAYECADKVLSDPKARAAFRRDGSIPSVQCATETPASMLDPDFMNFAVPIVNGAVDCVRRVYGGESVLGQLKSIGETVYDKTRTPEGQRDLKAGWDLIASGLRAVTGKP